MLFANGVISGKFKLKAGVMLLSRAVLQQSREVQVTHIRAVVMYEHHITNRPESITAMQ